MEYEKNILLEDDVDTPLLEVLKKSNFKTYNKPNKIGEFVQSGTKNQPIYCKADTIFEENETIQNFCLSLIVCRTKMGLDILSEYGFSVQYQKPTSYVKKYESRRLLNNIAYKESSEEITCSSMLKNYCPGVGNEKHELSAECNRYESLGLLPTADTPSKSDVLNRKYLQNCDIFLSGNQFPCEESTNFPVQSNLKIITHKLKVKPKNKPEKSEHSVITLTVCNEKDKVIEMVRYLVDTKQLKNKSSADKIYSRNRINSKKKRMSKNIEVGNEENQLICTTSFKNKQIVTRSIHKCNSCRINFEKLEDYIEHRKTHLRNRPRPFTCQDCNKHFLFEKALARHRNKEKKCKKSFKCSICEKDFRKFQDLVAHKRTFHKGAKPFKCAACPKAFKQKGQLRDHVNAHMGVTPFQCSQCGKSFSSSTLLYRHKITTHSLKQFKCCECGISCKTKKNLVIHSRIHTGENTYSCPVCCKRFATKHFLDLHHKVAHLKLRPWLCSECGKTFSSNSSLKIHVHDIHSDGKKCYLCSFCGLRCSNHANLCRHMELHSHEKKYQCDKCGKKFSQKQGLIQHIQSHLTSKAFTHGSTCKMCNVSWKDIQESTRDHLMSHRKAGKKAKYQYFRCEICFIRFPNKSELMFHKLTHKGNKYFKCSKCHKGFSSPQNLVRHSYLHSDKKQFQCDECEKAFSQYQGLFAHKLTHRGVRRHKCTICPKGFVDKSTLLRHMDKHPEEGPFRCGNCEKIFIKKSGLAVHMKTHLN